MGLVTIVFTTFKSLNAWSWISVSCNFLGLGVTFDCFKLLIISIPYMVGYLYVNTLFILHIYVIYYTSYIRHLYLLQYLCLIIFILSTATMYFIVCVFFFMYVLLYAFMYVLPQFFGWWGDLGEVTPRVSIRVSQI